MATDHEFPAPVNPAPDRDELRWDHLVDNTGFTPNRADKAISGSDPDRVPYPKPRTRQSRPSHRGGRSYPETSDRELDPNWNVLPTPLTETERASSHAGYLAARAELDLNLDQKHIDRLHDEAHAAELRGEDTHPGALWRARQERRQR